MQAINQLLGVFESYRMPPTATDEFETKGKQLLADKFESFTSRNRPIEFVMLGFPFKSINVRDKVLGALPDLGELLTLKNFSAFNEDIKKVYAPGVKINMVTDGYVFNDLLEIPDKNVNAYYEMNQYFGNNSPIEWYNMYSFVKGREHLMSNFGISETELERRILFDQNVNTVYRGIMIFMKEETAMKEFPSNKQHQKFAKKLARQVMFRNEAYSDLVAKEFSHAVRLTMHPSNNVAKYGFQLIKGKETRHSAWHCAIAVDGAGQLITIHRKDAEEKGYELIYENNQPFYYANRKSNF